MPGEVVNLRLARKRRERVADERNAEEARAKHGLTKGRRKADAAAREAARRHLDGHEVE